jgi:putative addiction module component (TIGR02574 family)
MTALRELEKTVLALPLEQRALLAESLLGSLPPVEEEWSDEEEVAEVERREREIDAGQAQALNDAEFWNRVENRRNR